ncbi:Uncharacterized protein FKW44_001330 [Caligus rogercresseyi]|uniref:Uncharacterized protein n=1 Tax=Caligus rogercresseyi TaxID=217165 RepID=A0A7T8KIK9_CALRO|nr:Uncharacterized protein FKW44_001330 [Caligus rogercresseyi]
MEEESEENNDDGYMITTVIINDKGETDYDHQETEEHEDEEDSNDELGSTAYLRTKIADKFKNVADHFDTWSQSFESIKVASPKRGRPDLKCPEVHGSPSCRQYDGQDECRSSGGPDPSCPGGICCFNGCSNVCFQSSLLQRRVKNEVKPDEDVCPKPKGFQECNLYERSECWSPDVPDLDCPESALCCFDGCRNICMDGSNERKHNVNRKSNAKPFPEFPNFYSFTSAGDAEEKPLAAFTGQPQIHAPKSTIQIYPVSFLSNKNNGSPGKLYAVPMEDDERYNIHIEEDYNQQPEINDEHIVEDVDDHIDTSGLINRLSDYESHNNDNYNEEAYEDIQIQNDNIDDDIYGSRPVKPVENIIRLTKGSRKPVIYISNTFHIPTGIEMEGSEIPEGIQIENSQIPEGIQIEDYDRSKRRRRVFHRTNLEKRRQAEEESERRAHRYNGLLTPTVSLPEEAPLRTGNRRFRQCPSISGGGSAFCGQRRSIHSHAGDKRCAASTAARTPAFQVLLRVRNKSSLESCSVDGECRQSGATCCFDGCRDVCMGLQRKEDEKEEVVSELLSSPDLIRTSLEKYFYGG